MGDIFATLNGLIGTASLLVSSLAGVLARLYGYCSWRLRNGGRITLKNLTSAVAVDSHWCSGAPRSLLVEATDQIEADLNETIIHPLLRRLGKRFQL